MRTEAAVPGLRPLRFQVRVPPPCLALGFFPMAWPLLPHGGACSHASDIPMRSATTSQRHAVRPSCSGSGRSVPEPGIHLSASSSAPPVPSHGDHPYSVCHTDFGRSAYDFRYGSFTGVRPCPYVLSTNVRFRLRFRTWLFLHWLTRSISQTVMTLKMTRQGGLSQFKTHWLASRVFPERSRR